jgi:signal transduction histidine kinase/CheY-like chemotaxis protein
MDTDARSPPGEERNDLDIDESPATRSLNEELIALLARQSRWVPVPLFFGALLIFAVVFEKVPTLWAVLWLSGVAGILTLRFFVLGRLPAWRHIAETSRLRIATVLSGVNGVMHGSAVAFFPFLAEFERFTVFITMLAWCAGSVSTTAGYRPVFLAYLAPTLAPLAIMWAINPGADVGWQQVFVAALTLLFGLVLVRLSVDASRLFKQSFGIRLKHVDLNRRLENALNEARVLNQRLEEALQESRVANAAKTRFLAAASHDLRQPVHALALFSETLLHRPLDDRSREIVNHLVNALDALSLQLDALLDISKLDAGIVKANPDPFDLSRMLERLREQYQPLAAEKGLQLTVSYPPRASVNSDEMLLEQIVRNLLGNAVKYTDSGAISLRAEERGSDLLLSIADTGRGIPAELHEQVFEEFFQIDNPGRDRSKGLGLGLAITRRLSKLLHIPLRMTSEPGEGTTFELKLARSALPSAPASPRAEPGSLNRLAVLVVDDEPTVLQGMRLLLEELGCTVELATGTEHALRVAADWRPEVVICDYRLSGNDTGLQTIRKLREFHPALPAILVTGDTGPDRLVEAHREDLTLLHKPVKRQALALAIFQTGGARSGERHVEARD